MKVARTVSRARDGCNVFITSSGLTNSDDREDVSRGTGKHDEQVGDNVSQTQVKLYLNALQLALYLQFRVLTLAQGL